MRRAEDMKMMQKPSKFWMHAVLTALVALPVGAASAAPAARVTGTIGDNTAGDAALALRESLDEGANVVTSEDGGCSLLIDDDLVMEACGDTRVSLERKDGKDDGARVVRLERGNVRMVVEPRGVGEEKVEIHTPAAIATVLGTILHVNVDALGVAEVTSEANRVQVASTNPNITKTVVLEPGQTVQIAVDGTLGDVVELDPDELAARGNCFDLTHDAALAADSRKRTNSKIESVNQKTIEEVETPAVGSPGGEGGFTPPGDPGGNTNPNLPPDVTNPPVDMMTEPMEPPTCGPAGIPGETCF